MRKGPRPRFGARWALMLVLVMCGAQAQEAGDRVQRGEFGFVYSAVPAWVEQAGVADQWPADAPGAQGTSWRNWLIDAQVDLRGPTPLRYYDHAIEATTQEMVADVAKLSLQFNPEYQTLAIHRVALRRDGVWHDRYDPQRITLARREREFESNMATGTVSALIVVDDVRPGDVVRYAYSVQGENPVLAGMTHEEFLLAWVDPILERRVRVEWPPATPVDAKIIGDASVPTIERSQAGGTVRFVGRAIAGIKVEQDTPGWHATHPRLQVAPRRRWADVADWSLSLYPGNQPLPEDLEQRIATWRSLPSIEARVSAALQAVQEEIRYFSVLLGESTHRPALPSITWTRRFGDCKDKAWLLATVLQRLDIPAVPAMASVRIGRGVGEALPAASQFDHVIVRATVAGQSMWFDPTLTQQRGPLIARRAPDYGLALPVAAATRTLEPMGDEHIERSRTIVHEQFEPSSDGATINFSVVTVHSGARAEQQRRDLSSQGAAEMARHFADYYRRVHGDLEVSTGLEVEDDAASGRLTLRESYVLKKPWTLSTPGARAFDLYADTFSGQIPLSGEVQRMHPLLRAHPMVLEHVTRFVVPETWRLDSPPSPVETGDASFRYRREISREKSSLVMHQSYESLADHVATADLARHFEVRREAAAALSSRLTLSLPAQASRSERDRRLRSLLRDIMDEKDGKNAKD